MKVELFNYSQTSFNDDAGRILPQKSLLEQIAYAARVSNPSNQDNSDTAENINIGHHLKW